MKTGDGGYFRLKAPRTFDGAAGAFPEFEFLVNGLPAEELVRVQQLGKSEAFRKLFSALVPQPALVVESNRQFEATSPRSQVRPIGDLDTFVGLLDASMLIEETENVFASVDSDFALITEGLRLKPALDPPLPGPPTKEETTTRLFVVEDGARRPISSCGDGLRDLAFMLFHLHALPHFDLLFDEPGLRLHPSGQRRLLGVLSREAKHRALWLAAHDGVFIGSPTVVSRHLVTRSRPTETTSLTALGTREEVLSAVTELGWRPEDAILADRVLFCEGPSDEAVFRICLQRLAESDAAISGVVLQRLGGDGEVRGKRARGVRERIAQLRALAPHAKFVIVLDDAARQATPNVDGAELRALLKGDLEDYLLEPSLVYQALTMLAADEDVLAPSEEDVVKKLGTAAAEPRKNGKRPSAAQILQTVADEFGLPWAKIRWAQKVGPLLPKYAEKSFQALCEELKTALNS
ncbi:MAG: ATP-dependent nuclease [Myxococcaceae bacterium]